jgi:hypothetical protein
MTHASDSIAELDSVEKHRNQRAEWIAERAGHCAMLGLVVLAVAGLFGGSIGGPAKAGNTDGLAVQYDGILRKETPARLLLTIVPEQGSDVTVALSQSFTDACEILSISPEPVKMTAAGETLGLHFERLDSTNAVVVNLRFEADRWGQLSYTVQGANDDNIEIRQWVLP